MSKIILVFFLFFCVSINSCGQASNEYIDFDKIIVKIGGDETLAYAIVLKCKNYEFLVEDTDEDYKRKIKGEWIESINRYKNETELKKFGISSDGNIIKIELNSKKWNFFSSKLKKKFKASVVGRNH